jgi:hypothetical protein
VKLFHREGFYDEFEYKTLEMQADMLFKPQKLYGSSKFKSVKNLEEVDKKEKQIIYSLLEPLIKVIRDDKRGNV